MDGFGSTSSIFNGLKSFEDLELSCKTTSFAGAVLSPKHAKDLTPAHCLGIVCALIEQAPTDKGVVPYTLWITEAWRVLGWAEPSAALFWEMSTLYHTLYISGKALDEQLISQQLPAILSVGSNSSLGSSQTYGTERPIVDKKKLSTAASAKELPIWIVGTFLLLHCEEYSYRRNVSSQDDRRFHGGGHETASTDDHTSLIHHTSLSPRSRLHAGWNQDNSHCSAFVLTHLRKIMLLTAVPHNPEAVRACLHLAALASPAPTATSRSQKYVAEDIRRLHMDLHDQVGLNVSLTLDDLERLHFLFEPVSGGGIEDPPVNIGEYFWERVKGGSPPPMAKLSLGDVEKELRLHLEAALAKASNPLEETATTALSRLSLSERDRHSIDRRDMKRIDYTGLRSTTVIRKPIVHEATSGASTNSGEPNFTGSLSYPKRLHDILITDCNDVHFYLLQPFEHVTISGCVSCTIVIGAVAGILHIVDCEKTKITCCARRALVTNSSDTEVFIFTPSPPLLVGDNRSCQLAPYNTYYDGLREDLLATGLAAAVVSEHSSPFHGARSVDSDPAWPPLQCASNKWKVPIEMSKLEMPQVPYNTPGVSHAPSPPSSPGADDKAMNKSMNGSDATMYAPILLSASDFNMIFVPFENELSRTRRLESEETCAGGGLNTSQYTRVLADMLSLSPFRLPIEYERRVLLKMERMKTIQHLIQKSLEEDKQTRFGVELNNEFREWLVASGNLRQILDLVHLERENQS